MDREGRYSQRGELLLLASGFREGCLLVIYLLANSTEPAGGVLYWAADAEYGHWLKVGAVTLPQADFRCKSPLEICIGGD
jgi:hypothetical protein